MDLVVYDDDEKRYVPWAVALAAVLLVALLAAALTFLLVRQASGSEDEPIAGVGQAEPATAPSATTSTATPTAAPTAAAAPSAAAAAPPAPAAGATSDEACDAALLRADAALERSVALDEALTRHTQIMDELLAERIDAQEALDRTLPVLTGAATERRRFQDDLSAYAESRQDCPA